MIPLLNDKDAIELATKYSFSGGEIENIARKHIIDNILSEVTNIKPNTLQSYCESEKIREIENHQKIGY